MKKVLNLYKPVGTTPLQLISAFREKYPEYRDVKLGFAGRLDPMADGVLLVLVGDENKKREEYNALPKTYSFDCLFGITTDTYDALGLITGKAKTVSIQKISEHLPAVLSEMKKKITQQYPAYSSMTVRGKPLYYWARNNLLHEVTIPSHPINIYELRLKRLKEVAPSELQHYIFESIQKVKGDFRQTEIAKGWEKFFAQHTTAYVIASCIVSCSSGTYVRSLCEELGEKLSVGGLALSITRDCVGNHPLKDSLKII